MIVGFLINNPIPPCTQAVSLTNRGMFMAEEKNKIFEWLSWIGIGSGIFGILMVFPALLISFLCLFPPIFSQAAVVIGLIAYVKSAYEQNKKVQFWGMIAMVLGIIGLVLEIFIYIGEISL